MKVINWDSNTVIRIQLWDIAGEFAFIRWLFADYYYYFVNEVSRQTRDYKRRIYSETQTSFKKSNRAVGCTSFWCVKYVNSVKHTCVFHN